MEQQDKQQEKQHVEFDKRYGKCLWYDLYDDGETAPVLVAIMEQKGAAWLDVRRMYWRSDSELGFGKGVRVELASNKALDILGMAQAGVTAHAEGYLLEEQTDEDADD